MENIKAKKPPFKPEAASSAVETVVMRTVSFLRELFCWHDYEDPIVTGYLDPKDYPNATKINHGKKVSCKKCGKEKWLWSGWVHY